MSIYMCTVYKYVYIYIYTPINLNFSERKSEKIRMFQNIIDSSHFLARSFAIPSIFKKASVCWDGDLLCLNVPQNHNYPTTSLHFIDPLPSKNCFPRGLLGFALGFRRCYRPTWLKHLEKNRRRPHCRISSRWQGGDSFMIRIHHHGIHHHYPTTRP